MMSRGKLRALLATTVIAGTAFNATVASAQQVVLRSNDGSATITGELIEFADGFYRLRTELGELRLSASRMVCEGDACPQFDTVEADLTFAGSDTIGQGLMPLLMAGWANSVGGEADVQNGPEPNTAVAELIADQGFGDPLGTYLVRSSGSDDAFTSLEDGSAQLGMSARRILPAEARALRAAGAGNMIDVKQEHIIAVDPITVIVNPSNGIESLSLQDLAAIYAGRITNWSELGGADMPISVYMREPASATRTFFDDRVVGAGGVGAAADVVEDNNQMAASVNGNEGGIGYVGFAFQRGAKALALTSNCGLTVSPSAFSSKTEEYPLDRRLYLYARADSLTEDAQSFIDFVASPDSDGAIAKAGFIDLSVSRVSMEEAAERAVSAANISADEYERSLNAEMAEEMVNWERLSTTLRFATGSSRLDERGQIDLARLVDYLEYEREGTQVAVVGFTDSDGAFDGNRRLAGRRANQALEEIQAAANGRLDNIQFTTLGFGELSPAACNDSSEGKRVNRRVEVWIRDPQTASN